MKTPKWFLKRNIVAWSLVPLSWFYLLGSKIVFNMRKKNEYISRRPVICFGNILSGGVGKTPIVRNVAKFFDAPVIMRGYKKSKETDSIGDEAKMLSADDILVHVGNRKSNLILLNKQKSNTPIIMDDGFQNSSIKKDISVLVFDEGIGFGNGFLLPAGPLREKKSAMQRADAIIVIKRKNARPDFAVPTNVPVFYAKNSEVCSYDKNTHVVAFAGIGYPDKFFDNVPCKVVERIYFPDHYQYGDEDIKKLIDLAAKKNAKLLTTEKDWVRLPKWAQKEIKFSALQTEIESKFYDWLKGKVNEISKQKIKLSGVGIHSGLPVNIVVKPSDKSGIYFKRTDIKGSDLIPAKYDNVSDTLMRNTTIGDKSNAYVQTVEHLMAALFVSGVNGAVVEIDGPETPILDGSAYEFINAFAGIATNQSKIKKIIVKKPIIAYRNELVKTMPFWKRLKITILNHTIWRRGNGYVKLSPNDTGLLIDATLVYKDKIIGTQSYSCLLDGTKKSINKFIKDVSRSRTFGKYSEWEYLKAHGMGHGANENNVIALNDAGDGVLNKLYYPDEFVRHKIIDAVGDMFTSGGFIYGHLESYKGSHALNNLVLRKLFSDKSNYEIIEK